jgi:hypothetical protein
MQNNKDKAQVVRIPPKLSSIWGENVVRFNKHLNFPCVSTFFHSSGGLHARYPSKTVPRLVQGAAGDPGAFLGGPDDRRRPVRAADLRLEDHCLRED